MLILRLYNCLFFLKTQSLSFCVRTSMCSCFLYSSSFYCDFKRVKRASILENTICSMRIYSTFLLNSLSRNISMIVWFIDRNIIEWRVDVKKLKFQFSLELLLLHFSSCFTINNKDENHYIILFIVARNCFLL